ncbi:RND transporter MFP subunit [Caballeronia mineralivorans PML1(12)]|uniref:RND transporter MFP subunit n=1 Tax=Caballeronia mineralivorans PML1(12) TaxID=908627 RepID=A0A0J1FLC0_9BURK|nr:copper-binding protein [Caballeronia mineralivorans]KLU20508.1 RND transporter MFP subunit [Caballeronia mineralivorans PML1(12)]
MKKLVNLGAVFFTTVTLASTALAADNNMAGMKMDGDAMSAMAPHTSALTDAVVKKVDTSTGMVTLQHGALKNIGMSAMTMAYKAKDASMVKQAKEGEKVKVRVENVDGTLTIVTLMKR